MHPIVAYEVIPSPQRSRVFLVVSEEDPVNAFNEAMFHLACPPGGKPLRLEQSSMYAMIWDEAIGLCTRTVRASTGMNPAAQEEIVNRMEHMRFNQTCDSSSSSSSALSSVGSLLASSRASIRSPSSEQQLTSLVLQIIGRLSLEARQRIMQDLGTSIGPRGEQE